MAVAAVVFGVLALTQRQEADDLRTEASRNAEVAALLASPGSRVVTLSGPDAPGGAAVVLAEGQAPVLVSTLGDAPADRTYQIWGIPDDGGAPRSLGFAGEGSDVVQLPADAFDGAEHGGDDARARGRLAGADDDAVPRRPDDAGQA